MLKKMSATKGGSKAYLHYLREGRNSEKDENSAPRWHPVNEEGYIWQRSKTKSKHRQQKKAKRINIFFFFFFSFSCSNVLIFSEERHPQLT
jgi:hypothetical protein